MTTFESQQEALRGRIEKGDAKFILLDPDGTLPPWLGVVIESQSGAVYAAQCAGTNTEMRMIEGYFIPLGGVKMSGEGQVDPRELYAVFHRGKSCWGAGKLPDERLEQLRRAVAEIPCWETPHNGQERREALKLDETRLDELCEAWVPVLTVNGRGILVWKNCD